MKKLALITLFLLSYVSANAAGWVYMGYYPYMYDNSTARWSYSPAPVIWHQDLFTAGWYNIGTPPPNLTPSNLHGRTIEVWSTLEQMYYDFSFSSYDQYYGVATVGVYSFGFYYVYKEITNSQAQILAYDGSQLYDYTLVFQTATSGYWDGYSINNDGVFSYYGTFNLK